jgi:phosphoribosylaminoimidazole (AIR) synthetase
MLKIFNYGVGCAIYVDGDDAARETVQIARSLKLNAIVAGEVLVSDRREVVVEPISVSLSDDSFALGRD